MSSWGRTEILTVGRSIKVTADGQPEPKVAGVTLDWGTVTAAAADVTLPDGVVVKTGEKYIRYGQILTTIGGAEVQTVEYTGGPTGGGATLTLAAVGDDAAQTTASIAYNATAQAFADALNALSRIGPNGVTVARAGAGSAGDPYIYTVTFQRGHGNVPQLTSANTFTGGTTPSVTHATTTAGTGTGKVGPYDPSATDGRATLARGFAWINNYTMKETDLQSDHPEVIDGGRVFRDRLLVTAAGTGTLALGPTFTNFEAAFPRVSYVAESPQ